MSGWEVRRQRWLPWHVRYCRYAGNSRTTAPTTWMTYGDVITQPIQITHPHGHLPQTSLTSLTAFKKVRDQIVWNAVELQVPVDTQHVQRHRCVKLSRARGIIPRFQCVELFLSSPPHTSVALYFIKRGDTYIFRQIKL